MQHALNEDPTLDKIVNQVSQSNLIGLGKALLIIEKQNQSYSLAASELNRIATRLVEAAYYAGGLLPESQRVVSERRRTEEEQSQQWLKAVDGWTP